MHSSLWDPSSQDFESLDFNFIVIKCVFFGILSIYAVIFSITQQYYLDYLINWLRGL